MNILRKIREIDRAVNEGLITYEEAANLVQPFTDAEPVKHGYWVTKWNQYDKDGYVIRTIGRCSCCNQYSDVLDYCGNCGAKMED